MNKFEKNFEVESGLIVNIKRIILDESIRRRHKLIPIKNSAFWLVDLGKENEFFLPQLYAALTYLTGPGDFSYDDYKGSYSFTFELNVKKNMNSQYLYHIYHYRSYIEFSVYQKVAKNDPRDSRVLHDPDDTLFSDKDICLFSAYFCSYLLGYLEGSRHQPEPFVKNSDSNLLLFGYLENKYFIEQYEDHALYLKEKTLLNEKCFSH
jgi:hypothetical protein